MERILSNECYTHYVRYVGLRLNKLLWGTLVAFLAFLALSYAFLPLGRLQVPIQEQYMQDSQIKIAISSLAGLWSVPEHQLIIFALESEMDNTVTLSILDTNTFASAVVWIPRHGREHDHSVAQFGPPTSDMHLLAQYIPKSRLEKVTVQNFYIKNRTALIDKAIVTYVNQGILFGSIRVLSLREGELRYPTIFTLPLFAIKLHFDPY